MNWRSADSATEKQRLVEAEFGPGPHPLAMGIMKCGGVAFHFVLQECDGASVPLISTGEHDWLAEAFFRSGEVVYFGQISISRCGSLGEHARALTIWGPTRPRYHLVFRSHDCPLYAVNTDPIDPDARCRRSVRFARREDTQ